MSTRTRLWRGNDHPEPPEIRRAEVFKIRSTVSVDHLPVKTLPRNLARASQTRPLPSSYGGHSMIPRALSSAAKKRVTLAPPVRKRDESTNPGVTTKARTVLPRLPIPPLRGTLDKYLQSIKPLLQEDDLRGTSTFDSAYQRRVQWAKEFETGIGATLQARLVGTYRLFSTLAVPTVSQLIGDIQPWTRHPHTIGLMITSGYARRTSNGGHRCSLTQTGG